MKRLFSFILLAAMALSLHAQIKIKRQGKGSDSKKEAVCDTLRYRVAYQMRFVNDTTQTPYNYKDEEMWLDVGDRCSKFYSRTRQVSDSLTEVMLSRGEIDFTNVKVGRVGWHLFTNHPEGHFLFCDSPVEDFKVLETIDYPDWELQSDSLAEVLGYTCMEAVAQYKGRTWHVWFAEEVPLSYGPWKLSGLPGLVLRAYDSGHQYEFEATGMQKCTSGKIFTDEAKREKVSRKEYEKTKRRVAADPIGALNQSFSGAIIKVTDPSGNEITGTFNLKYNPIER